MVDKETEVLVDEVEASWEKRVITIPNVTLDDAPLKELLIKAHNILASETHETLDALVCRIADVIPEGVTEENFAAAKPLAGACKNWFSNVEKLRTGLKRPALDWGKAVDTSAKQWVARAEPTLNPIIDKVKQIEDRRKAEKLAAEAAEAKRVEDERLAAEKAHRDMLEAEQAAERARVRAEQDAEDARLAAVAEANRVEAEKLAAERREVEEMKRWIAEREARVVSSEDAKKIVEAPDDGMVPIPASNDIALNERVSERIDAAYDEGLREAQAVKTPPIALAGEKCGVVIDEAANWPTPHAKQVIGFNSPAIGALRPQLEGFVQSVHSDTKSEADMHMVRQFGNDVYAFIYGDAFKKPIHRPACVSSAAKQAVELAVFDLCEIAKRLQEWSGN